jgi:DNA-binding transcriptional LysR family regulator
MLNGIHLSSIDLNLLVLFDAVLKEAHVGRAASQLGLSPSAVSHGLGRLRRLFHDPLFLRTPKGVVPTERAERLAGPVADILLRVQSVVATGTPFDPATSTRRFTLGMPDATAAVILPSLLAQTSERAPFIDLSVRQVFPQHALAELEARTIDVAICPIAAPPARFVAKPIYQERFVIAARVGHPFLASPTLKHYTEARHVLASQSGDAHGFVDQLLERKGLSRRVALVVPTFLLALAALAESDLIAAVPASLTQLYAARFGVTSVEPPLPLRNDQLCALATRAALMDAGLAWLFETLNSPSAPPRRQSEARRTTARVKRAR